MTQHTTLTIKDLSPIELPVYKGTLGPEVIDVAQLAKNNLFTYDPGFLSTAACKSEITFVDGEKGELLYRGYPIAQLAEKSDFIEVAYLLLYGELPSATEKEEFNKQINNHTLVDEQLRYFFNGFRRDAHPMAIMIALVGALSSFYHASLDIHNTEHQQLVALRLIAKMPTLVAMCYKFSTGLPFMYPSNDLSYTENFLHMMFGVPTEKRQPNPVFARALDKIFILHADHEQNASTSTVRLIGSTGADPYACISAGFAALWGPAHGGANEAAVVMLREIGDVAHIKKYIEKAKDPNDPFRLMGFGHRVYKNYDPRGKVMREICLEVLAETGQKEAPLFKIALALEKIALEDPYFIERKLYPNVDFYSGIILTALGIPTNMFTVIFAMARTVGWISHWKEMLAEPKLRIARPRQLYCGKTKRDFIPLEKREINPHK